MPLTIGGFTITRQARTRDPKREAQEAAARGDWRPTDRMLRKADPDFVKRFFIAESLKQNMRRLYARAVLMNSARDSRDFDGSHRDQAQARSHAFWEEYASLDDKWVGDLPDIKKEVQ